MPVKQREGNILENMCVTREELGYEANVTVNSTGQVTDPDLREAREEL